MTEENPSKFNRRTILKSAGAVAGLGFTAPVEAERHGPVQFSELRLVHDVSLPSNTELTYPFTHVDEFSHNRVVDEDRSAVYINERYAKEELELAKREESIVAGIGFAALPAAFGERDYRIPTTRLDEDYRANQEISVSDYRQPGVSVSQEQGKLFIESEGTETTVNPGDEVRTVLPEQEVSVEAYKTVETDPDEITIAGGEEWQEPWRKPNRREYETKTVTITPKIVARNLGELEVVGVRAKGPKYKPKANG